MYQENAKFVTNYISDAADLFEATKGRPLEASERTALEARITARIQDGETVHIDNRVANTYEPMSMRGLLDLTCQSNVIISPFGALFNSDRNDENYPGRMLKDLKGVRSIFKGAMFDALTSSPDGQKDHSLFQRKKSGSNGVKLIMNSFFGVLGSRAFILFNKLVPGSITYGAYAQTSTVAVAMENHFTDNVNFNNKADLLKFLKEFSHDYSDFNLDLAEWHTPLVGDAAVERTVARLVKKCDFEIDELYVRELVAVHGDDYVNRLYLKNNFYEFFKDKRVLNLTQQCVHMDFLDSDEPPEEVAEYCEQLYQVVKEFVGHHHLTNDRYKVVHAMDRENILLTDTDSIFTLLDRFVAMYRREFDTVTGDDKVDTRMTMNISLIVVFLSAKFVTDVLTRLSTNGNILKQNQPIFCMKSELLYSRAVTTANKKSYSGWPVLQEGRILKGQDIDIKGIPIRKVGTATTTRDFFFNLLKGDIMTVQHKDGIPIDIVLRKIERFKQDIRTAIVNDGSVIYAKTKPYNTFSSYKVPYQNEIVRGVELWNALNPDGAIADFSQARYLKLSCEKISTFEELFDKETYPGHYEIIKELAFSDDIEAYPISNFGLSGIALPLEYTTIPAWLRPVADVNGVIADSVASFNVVLQALGVAVIPARDGKKQLSNFIKI